MVDIIDRSEAPYNDAGERGTMLDDLYSGSISVQVAAERLASLSLAEGDLYSALGDTWSVILGDVIRTINHHDILAELLVAVANLPPAKDEQGNQLTIYDLRVWDDLPTFGWEMYEDWHRSARSDVPSECEERIANSIMINKFAARLMRAGQGQEVFNYSFFVIATMRKALEEPESNPDHDVREAAIPSAVAWVTVMGSDIYTWNKEFPYGGRLGDRGKGGALWEGKHGFCVERWQLWKRRFGELSRSTELSDELRGLAEEGAVKMNKVEIRAVAERNG